MSRSTTPASPCMARRSSTYALDRLALGRRRQHHLAWSTASSSFTPLADEATAHDAHIVNTASIGGLQVNPAWKTGSLLDEQIRRGGALSEGLAQRTGSARTSAYRCYARAPSRPSLGSRRTSAPRAPRRRHRTAPATASSSTPSRAAPKPERRRTTRGPAPSEDRQFFIFTDDSRTPDHRGPARGEIKNAFERAEKRSRRGTLTPVRNEFIFQRHQETRQMHPPDVAADN